MPGLRPLIPGTALDTLAASGRHISRSGIPYIDSQILVSMSHQEAIQSLRSALGTMPGTPSGIAALCRNWRAQTALLAALPPRFTEVAEHFLGRLEAASLFSEESCSFSQQDLLDHLGAWLDQAQLALQKSAGA